MQNGIGIQLDVYLETNFQHKGELENGKWFEKDDNFNPCSKISCVAIFAYNQDGDSDEYVADDFNLLLKATF